MQPPLHITGNPTADWLVLVVGWFVCLYWLRGLRLAREGARRFLRNIAKTVLLYCAAILILTAAKPDMPRTQAQGISGLVAFVFFVRWQGEKRSRYIPKSVRRAIIKRDLKGGQFDPDRHHVDHLWPFSKGGSHTTDNLRVIEKKKNLQKGAKRPRMREMW